MKEIDPGLAAHLATGATTLAWCWRLTRKDGASQGFTDHDRDVAFDGTTFEAAAGFTASEIKDALGLSVGNLEVSGALSSAHLAEGDLAAGLYDDAKIEIWRVNWQAPHQRVLMRSGSLGEVKRAGLAFSAEVRGLAHYLNQPKGRLFQYTCDADLGDTRCGVALSSSIHKGTGAIGAVIDARRFTATGLAGFASGWFTRGLVRFTSGAANGQRAEVREHRLSGAIATLDLWVPARLPLTAGQTFEVTAGCDKHLATCRGKFGNAVNFRGFPHMPGNDFVTSIARPGE
jgi:uncharacterized phage protein (TIGR02218 family)